MMKIAQGQQYYYLIDFIIKITMYKLFSTISLGGIGKTKLDLFLLFLILKILIIFSKNNNQYLLLRKNKNTF